MERRLTALRLVKIDILIVKESLTPVAYMLKITEPLTDAQLKRLTLATPWAPVIIEACVGAWDENAAWFDASISLIETQSKIAAAKHKKTLQWGQVKRQRGFISHD